MWPRGVARAGHAPDPDRGEHVHHRGIRHQPDGRPPRGSGTPGQPLRRVDIAGPSGRTAAGSAIGPGARLGANMTRPMSAHVTNRTRSHRAAEAGLSPRPASRPTSRAAPAKRQWATLSRNSPAPSAHRSPARRSSPGEENVICTIAADAPGPHLMLEAHMDTVALGPMTNGHEPYMDDEGRLHRPRLLRYQGLAGGHAAGAPVGRRRLRSSRSAHRRRGLWTRKKPAQCRRQGAAALGESRWTAPSSGSRRAWRWFVRTAAAATGP